jgi:hypothetical protein
MLLQPLLQLEDMFLMMDITLPVGILRCCILHITCKRNAVSHEQSVMSHLQSAEYLLLTGT